MSTRERRNEQVQPDTGDEPQAEHPASEHVESLRRHATELLATARSVIDETLSGESEDYLNSVRQQGGQ
jgi:hypothetical protein